MKLAVTGYVTNTALLSLARMFDGTDKSKGVMAKNTNMGAAYIYKDTMARNSYAVHSGTKGSPDIPLHLRTDMLD